MRHSRVEPGPGQESVWDYPRPPRLEASEQEIKVIVEGITIAEAHRSYRVLETSHPPVYYLPPETIRMDLLHQSRHGTFCEWKGHAYYFTLKLKDRVIEDVAWAYKERSERFSAIADWLAFYPSKVDACFIDGERVTAQPGDFYGGWITSKVVGPFKGPPGTFGW